MNTDRIWNLLNEVPDPEIPNINVVEMGIVRDVQFTEDTFIVSITPTYSGCPAMHAIEQDIKQKLSESNVENFQVKTVLSPAWTTDWMTDAALRKLEEVGIAAPHRGSADKNLLMGKLREVKCPRCGSYDTLSLIHI